MFLPISTQSTLAPTITRATFVPRSNLRKVDDTAELLASNSGLESRLFSLWAGNNTSSQHLFRIHSKTVQHPDPILIQFSPSQVPGHSH